MVGQLPEAEQKVFELYVYGEHSQPEIAEILGISLRTVKRRWQSARLLLHQVLHGEMPES